jgi:hypothetical protein
VGLLTAAQLSAIQSGARVRQVWKIHAPKSSDHNTYLTQTIHDDYGSLQTVVDAGKRVVSGYNVSMSEPGELKVGDYTITVDNSSRRFYPGIYDGFFDPSAVAPVYYPEPQECLLEHLVYVMVSGAWSELTGVSYKGRIVDIIFDEGGNHDAAQPGTATITAENNIAAEILRYEWKEDDADDDVTLTTIYMEGS